MDRANELERLKRKREILHKSLKARFLELGLRVDEVEVEIAKSERMRAITAQILEIETLGF